VQIEEYVCRIWLLTSSQISAPFFLIPPLRKLQTTHYDFLNIKSLLNIHFGLLFYIFALIIKLGVFVYEQECKLAILHSLFNFLYGTAYE
jgi:hypothetical protein